MHDLHEMRKMHEMRNRSADRSVFYRYCLCELIFYFVVFFAAQGFEEVLPTHTSVMLK